MTKQSNFSVPLPASLDEQVAEFCKLETDCLGRQSMSLLSILKRGNLLKDMKRKVMHGNDKRGGGWFKFCEDRLQGLPPRTARRYMRVATLYEKASADDKEASVAAFFERGITGLLQHLRDKSLRPVDELSRPKPKYVSFSAARKMWSGLSRKERVECVFRWLVEVEELIPASRSRQASCLTL